MNHIPDQRADQRQSAAEEFLIEARTERVKNLQAGMDMIVVRSLAREHAENAARQA